MATFVVILILAGGGYLAYRNVKLGRGDRTRALRLGVVVFGLNVVAWLLGAEPDANPNRELTVVVLGCVQALFPAALIWVFYMAMEPHVRRIWPHGLIGWTRLFSAQFRDPLVGRDVLVGAAAGAVMALGRPLRHLAVTWIDNAPPLPDAQGLFGALGLRQTAVLVSNDVIAAINSAFLIVLLFVLLWMLVRRAWLALGLVAATLAVLIGSELEGAIVPGFVYLIVLVGMGAVVLWRFGVLALVTALFVEMSLRQAPFTLDLGAWYATPTWFVLGVLAALALFAFVGSRGGEPLLGRPLVTD